MFVATGASEILRARLKQEFLANVWPPVAEQIRRLDIDPATLIDGLPA
jgi:GntR family transcriptional regulator